MYRIRRLTGGEVNLASLDELAAAIAAGAVTADAEIYHQRAERWLPIANHPHFRTAKDRSESPARKPTPVPAPAQPPAPPALRLVRSDMAVAPSAPAPEVRPVSRWTPPQRSTGSMPPRPQGSAARAVDPASTVSEFVAEKPVEEVLPAPAPAEPPKLRRVEPATAGLPLLDVEMPAPPRREAPPRAPTPMPSRMQMPLALSEPGPMPIGTRQPTPMPSPAPLLTHTEPRSEPRFERVTSPVPEPVVVAPISVIPTPWTPPAVEPSLDLPPSVLDFSEPPVAIETATTLDVVFAAVAESAHVRTSSRWPMVAGAVMMAALIAFLALRPRAQVESLEPKPLASAPAAGRFAPSNTAGAPVNGLDASRPQITPVVPPGPSDATTELATKPTTNTVVPAAPKLSGIPASTLSNMGALDIPTDPTAPTRQKALEETRRQIETQMQH